jgi:hypothetical protein
MRNRWPGIAVNPSVRGARGILAFGDQGVTVSILLLFWFDVCVLALWWALN